MESQLNPKRRRDQNVYFPCFNFLQIARGDFGALGQFILRQFPAHPLPAHIRTEDLDSLPLFLGNGHDILHRVFTGNMNDTYIVKKISDFACQAVRRMENRLAPKNVLAARLFNMRFPQGKISASAGAPFGQRQQSRRVHFECLCQNHQFDIRDATQLRFYFRERAAAQIPAKNRTAGGKHSLRQLLLITQFANLRADNVLRFCHAPKMELDTTRTPGLNCSVFGAMCSVQTTRQKRRGGLAGPQKRRAKTAAGRTNRFQNWQTEIHPAVTDAPCGRRKTNHPECRIP